MKPTYVSWTDSGRVEFFALDPRARLIRENGALVPHHSRVVGEPAPILKPFVPELTMSLQNKNGARPPPTSPFERPFEVWDDISQFNDEELFPGFSGP
jgi:hypothetical protein